MSAARLERLRELLVVEGLDALIVDGKNDRIAKLEARKPGDPHPFINRGTYIRYSMISVECIEAQEGWVRAGKPQTSSRN